MYDGHGTNKQHFTKNELMRHNILQDNHDSSLVTRSMMEWKDCNIVDRDAILNILMHELTSECNTLYLSE